MRLLLDTHAFLWFIQGSSELSKSARSAIEDQDNQRFLSAASLWEMSIKVSISQSLVESMPLVTRDSEFKNYSAGLIW